LPLGIVLVLASRLSFSRIIPYVPSVLQILGKSLKLAITYKAVAQKSMLQQNLLRSRSQCVCFLSPKEVMLQVKKINRAMKTKMKTLTKTTTKTTMKTATKMKTMTTLKYAINAKLAWGQQDHLRPK
jgi:hypothetical protein